MENCYEIFPNSSAELRSNEKMELLPAQKFVQFSAGIRHNFRSYQSLFCALRIEFERSVFSGLQTLGLCYQETANGENHSARNPYSFFGEKLLGEDIRTSNRRMRVLSGEKDGAESAETTKVVFTDSMEENWRLRRRTERQMQKWNLKHI